MAYWTAVCEWDDRACAPRVDTHSQAQKLAKTMAHQRTGTPVYILKAVSEHCCHDATSMTVPPWTPSVMMPAFLLPPRTDMSFWMVQGLGATCRPPRFKHGTRDSAETEALRLARNNPGTTFAVLEATGSVIAQAVKYQALRQRG